MKNLLRALMAALTLGSIAFAQQTATPPVSPGTTYLRCSTLIDGKSLQPRKDVEIVVEGERIKDVRAFTAKPGPDVIQLQGTCLPGLIDTHTHIFLQGNITAADYDEQLLKQSVAYRTILALQSARKALEHGFTTIRDLETEGAGYADVDVKKAINRGIVPGPRMQVATRSLDVTGAYPLLGYSWELQMPHGVQVVDGPEEARKAVREEISFGADWIKFYSDRSYFVRPGGILDDIPTFTMDEVRAIVDEAHRQHRPVSSHASALNGVHNSVEAGVDTIEHGYYISDEDMKTMIAKGIWYVPTIYVAEYTSEGRAKAGNKVALEIPKIHAETFRRAVKAGVKIAFGTDVGGFSWDVNPAVEFALMVKYGMTNEQALDSALMKAAELMNMQDQIGSIESGKFADIIVVPGNPLQDIKVLEKANFVMKDGIVYKR